MASKGVKASLGPIAYQLYKKGWTLSSISERYKISVTSLSKWKKETLRPDQEADEWDLARGAHATRGETLRRLAEEQEEYAASLPVAQRDAKVHDSLSKSAANLRHWEEHQRSALAALLEENTTIAPEIDRPSIFLETLEWIALKLKDTDPEGLKVLARNFDTLVIQFKSEYAREAN